MLTKLDTRQSSKVIKNITIICQMGEASTPPHYACQMSAKFKDWRIVSSNRNELSKLDL